MYSNTHKLILLWIISINFMKNVNKSGLFRAHSYNFQIKPYIYSE